MPGSSSTIRMRAFFILRAASKGGCRQNCLPHKTGIYR
jgi:hypothetical protein